MGDIKKWNLVSVILPVYNVASYLKRCINSIITQSYQNLEIILIDDGSTDDSGAICDKYAEADSRIKVFHTENRGLSEARNYGFEMSHGDYILYIDPDDYIGESYIEILYNIITEKTVGFVQSGVAVVEPNYLIKRKERKTDESSVYLSAEAYMLKILKGEATLSVWGKLFKRSVIEKVKNPPGRLYEDNAVICYYAKESDYVCLENKAIYFHVVGRTGSITSTISKKSLKDLSWAIKTLTKDSNDLFPFLRDEAIKSYRSRMISIFGRLINNIPIVYLMVPFLLKKEERYIMSYLAAIRYYIICHLKDYMKLPMRRILQAIVICYMPWVAVVYVKIKYMRVPW